MNFSTFTEQFGLYFDGYIQDRVDQTIDTYGDGLIPSLEYLYDYNQGGKALRPYMVYLWYKLCGGQDDVYQMMSIGVINELIHTRALIHDDIADQGLIRRHRPTYHIQLRQVYDDDHVGDSQAMLVGDLAYSWAVSETVQIENTAARTIISDMIEKVIIGEILDIHYSYIDGEMDAMTIATKDDLKSGQYTFAAPMMLGATLAGATDEQVAAISEIGTIIGVAFQMRDDLLDWLPADDGKTKFSDIQEGNQTIVWSYLLAHASADEREHLLALRRKKLTKSDRERLHELVTIHELIQHIGSQINTDLQKARTLIEQGSWDAEYVTYMTELLDFLAIDHKK
ncbi:MAG: polyprenyl synthetase family protein [Candidatus Peribacteria bacterium]|nr:MAG: polyprenyl synthetase family protein [Candidatus Peribacteria bacterium]